MYDEKGGHYNMTKELKNLIFIDDSATEVENSFLFSPETAMDAIQAGHRVRGMSLSSDWGTSYIESMDLKNQTFKTKNGSTYVFS